MTFLNLEVNKVYAQPPGPLNGRLSMLVLTYLVVEQRHHQLSTHKAVSASVDDELGTDT